MKYQASVFANPSVLYFCVWIPLILISRIDLFFFSTRGDFLIEAYVVFLVLNFMLISGFCRFLFSGRRNVSRVIDRIDICALDTFTRSLFKIWLLGFFVNVIASGGLPLMWVLAGDVRTYSDFGVPTFSGLLNMLRMFMVVAVVTCASHKVMTPRWISIIIAASLIAELNRAAILFALLGAVGAFLLYNKLRLINLLRVGLVAGLFVTCFAYIAEFRELGRGGYVPPSDYFSIDVVGFGASMYILLYYVTPLNNLYHQFSVGIEPTFTPFFTFQSLLPTVVRDLIFTGDTVYSVEFASEVFNTSPYIANIISDFGLIGGAIVISIIQFFCCYVFFRAVRGSLEHALMAPVLWAATALSVFTNLYFTLVVVAFPALVYFFSRYRSRYLHRCKVAILRNDESQMGRWRV